MPRRESRTGRKRYARLGSLALDNAFKQRDKMRKDAGAEGGLPGEVPIHDKAMQRSILEELEPTGLSRLETDKLAEFRANRVGEVQ